MVFPQFNSVYFTQNGLPASPSRRIESPKPELINIDCYYPVKAAPGVVDERNTPRLKRMQMQCRKLIRTLQREAKQERFKTPVVTLTHLKSLDMRRIGPIFGSPERSSISVTQIRRLERQVAHICEGVRRSDDCSRMVINCIISTVADATEDPDVFRTAAFNHDKTTFTYPQNDYKSSPTCDIGYGFSGCHQRCQTREHQAPMPRLFEKPEIVLSRFAITETRSDDLRLRLPEAISHAMSMYEAAGNVAAAPFCVTNGKLWVFGIVDQDAHERYRAAVSTPLRIITEDYRVLTQNLRAIADILCTWVDSPFKF